MGRLELATTRSPGLRDTTDLSLRKKTLDFIHGRQDIGGLHAGIRVVSEMTPFVGASLTLITLLSSYQCVL